MSLNKRRDIKYLLDIAYQAAGNSAAQIIAIAGTPLLTRLYSPEAFAMQSIFVQVVIFISAFIMFRFEYFVPLLKDFGEVNALFKWGVRIGFINTFVLTFLILLVAYAGAKEVLGLNEIWYFYFAPITAFFVTLASFYQFEAQRIEKFKISALAEIASKLSYIFSGVLFSFYTVVSGLVLTTFFSALGKVVFLRRCGIRFLHPEESIVKDKHKEIIFSFKRRSMGMVFSNCLVSASGLVPLFFIGSRYGAATLGQFSLVMATIFLPSALIGSAIGSVFYQRAAKFWHERDFKGLQRVWIYTFTNLSLFSLPIYFLVYLISTWAYPFVFGEQWAQAGVFAKVLTVSAFFSFLAGPLDRISVIVGVGFYLPLIHGARFVLVLLLCFISDHFLWSVNVYLFYFSGLMAALYIFDILAGRFFLRGSEI